MDEKTQHDIIMGIKRRREEGLPSEFSRDMILSEVEKQGDSKWTITLYGAKCKFYIPEKNTATIYHLKVPKCIEGRGIGTGMIESAERVIRTQTKADTLRTSIGTSDGAMEHILTNKCGFTIIQKVNRKGLGEVLEAKKKI